MLGAARDAARGCRPTDPRICLFVRGGVAKDGSCVFLILPAPDTECFQIFLNTVAKRYSREMILMFVDGAGNHGCEQLVLPANIMLHPLPPYSPELNPQENIWDEIREKIFKNYALKSMDEVYSKKQLSTLSATQGSSNPSPRSPTSSSHCDVELVLGACTDRFC